MLPAVDLKGSGSVSAVLGLHIPGACNLLSVKRQDPPYSRRMDLSSERTCTTLWVYMHRVHTNSLEKTKFLVGDSLRGKTK